MKRDLPTLVNCMLKFIPAEFKTHRLQLLDRASSFPFTAPECRGNLFIECGDILYDLTAEFSESALWIQIVKAIWLDKDFIHA